MANDFRTGFSSGVKWAITWLHAEAKRMNDPHAKGVLNDAAFHLGTAKKNGQTIVVHEGHGEPCEICGKPCDAMTGNPSLWPVTLPYKQMPRPHHMGCVAEALAANEATYRRDR